MSVREYVATLLRDETGLTVLAGDIDTPQERPFINLRWNNTAQGIRSVIVRRQLLVWIHDKPNDYVQIDDILLNIKKLLGGVEGANHGTGFISQIDWQEDSLDLTDQGHRTITRYSTYQVVATEGVQNGD